MEVSRFAAWTRRRFGLTLLGRGGASLLTLGVFGGAEAKKKHKHKKKKKCKKPRASCGGTKKCCKGFTCGETSDQGPNHCCTADQGPNHCCTPLQGECTAPGECCGDFPGCTILAGLSGTRCCHLIGGACSTTQDCCAGFTCTGNQCGP